MAEEIVIDEDFSEKLSDWDESDVGKRIVKRVTPNGTYFNELIVQVFCQFCASEFIGPAREAGGAGGARPASWWFAQHPPGRR